MEAFLGARYVQIVCHSRIGHYLSADADGKGVRMADGQAARKTWEVQVVAGIDGEPAFLLRSFFGRYLLVMDIPVAHIGRRDAVLVEQGGLEQQPAPRPPVPPAASCEHRRRALDHQPPASRMIWKPIKNEGFLLIKNGSGGFLYGGRWRTAVTVGEYQGGTEMMWAVVPFQPELERMLVIHSQESLDVLEEKLIYEKKEIEVVLNERLSERKDLKKKIRSTERRIENFGDKDLDRKLKVFNFAQWDNNLKGNLASKAYPYRRTRLQKLEDEIFLLMQNNFAAKINIVRINRSRDKTKKLIASTPIVAID